MLINFCRKCLETTVTCSTVSNDGYEVTNLVSDSDKGFLVYSCIKPPINIDFTFVCDIEISHVLIWPSVGAQKSSGFELYVKSNTDWSDGYKRVSTGYLNATQTGLLFYRRDVDRSSAAVPTDFLQRYILISDKRSVNYVRNLRLSIVKTANSVPALGRIEIWGKVSTLCSKDTIARVCGLWQNSFTQLRHIVSKTVESSSKKNKTENSWRSLEKEPFDIPESFLDPITCTVMTQPIVLPSGAIIDQSTLEKHAETEAAWGRPLSDPFTGVPLNDLRKPIVASALKARIDKFLLDNNNRSDIKSMPRLLGYKQAVKSLHNRPLELSEITSRIGATTRDNVNIESTKAQSGTLSKSPIASSKLANNSSCLAIQQKMQLHRLPVIPMHSKRPPANGYLKFAKRKKSTDPLVSKEINIIATVPITSSEAEDHLDLSVQRTLSGLKRFNNFDQDNSRDCLKDCNCTTKIFYLLPCRHVVCKETLTSIKNARCPICHLCYNTAEVERTHRHLIIN